MDSKLRFSRVKTAQGRFSTQQRRSGAAGRRAPSPQSADIHGGRSCCTESGANRAAVPKRARRPAYCRPVRVAPRNRTSRTAVRIAPIRPPDASDRRPNGSEASAPSRLLRRAPPLASEPFGRRSGAPGGGSERCPSEALPRLTSFPRLTSLPHLTSNPWCCPSEARSALPVSTACDRGAARGTPFAAPAVDARTQEALRVLAVCRLAVCVCHEPLRPRGRSLRCPLSPSVGLLQTDALYDSRRPSSTRRLLRPRPGT